ncbi:MAG TPA: hypothetical protein P5511_07080 [Candidatus Goldiibacteriota bacterium]|nr:hypothetical protein [Candidatus Goldiibacteriota bacterium]
MRLKTCFLRVTNDLLIEYDQSTEHRAFKKADRMLRKYGACLGDMVENMYGYDSTMLPAYSPRQRKAFLKSLLGSAKKTKRRFYHDF